MESRLPKHIKKSIANNRTSLGEHPSFPPDEEEKFLFSGDTLFKLTVGRTDLWGGNLNELLDSVEKLMLLSDDYIVYTGHNISTTIGSERVRNRYLRKKRI